MACNIKSVSRHQKTGRNGNRIGELCKEMLSLALRDADQFVKEQF